jgi:hypothetical protein
MTTSAEKEKLLFPPLIHIYIQVLVPLMNTSVIHNIYVLLYIIGRFNEDWGSIVYTPLINNSFISFPLYHSDGEAAPKRGMHEPKESMFKSADGSEACHISTRYRNLMQLDMDEQLSPYHSRGFLAVFFLKRLSFLSCADLH